MPLMNIWVYLIDKTCMAEHFGDNCYIPLQYLMTYVFLLLCGSTLSSFTMPIMVWSIYMYFVIYIHVRVYRGDNLITY